MTQSLLAFDTDRIKSYVFATGKLAEIRGASALLDRLNRQTMPDIVQVDPTHRIYAHGGSGLFLVPTERVTAIITALQRRYHETTAAAGVTGVELALPEGFDLHSPLPSHWKHLGLRLRVAKDGNPDYAGRVAHPFLKACDSCGVFPAAQRFPEPGGEPALLCRSCAAKRAEDQRIKRQIPQVIQQEIKPNDALLWHRLVHALQQSGYPIHNRERPDDFTQLGEQSRPQGYLGLIYADGDGMGRRLETIPTLQAMRTFANDIDQALYGAVKQAILTHLVPEPDAASLPFDVLLLGGDDLVMVTTAQTALETALTIQEQFTALLQPNYSDPDPPGLSVAVILAHVNFPFGALFDIAESALKFAKKQRAKRGVSEGLLNFLVINSANHLDFKDYYNDQLRHLGWQNDDPDLYRTLRPYTAADMRQLLQTGATLRDAPRTKLEQLRRAVFEPRTQAMLEGMVALLRWRDTGQRECIQQFVATFADHQRQVNFPWFERNGTYHTPLLDLVELFDFLPR
jgi:hypothetical protein